MLSAAVAGSVFASPPPRNILHAIRCVAQGNEGTYNL
jgi:dihydroxyacetone kinase